MYQFESRIRYSEADVNCSLTLSALLNYYQDCSVFHSEAAGVGIGYLEKNHMAWMLSSWQVCLNELPKLGDKVQIQTWAHGMKGFYGYRNFSMNRTDGSRLAYADSTWVLIDTVSGRPVKVPQEMSETYGIEEEIPMKRETRKLVIPRDMEKQEAIEVPEYFIDSNRHMNNEKYVMIAHEFLPKDFQIREFRVEYKKEAKLGDIIYPSVNITGKEVSVLLSGADERPYAIVVFYG